MYSKAVILFCLVQRPQVRRRNNDTMLLGWCLLYFALIPLRFCSGGNRGSDGGGNGDETDYSMTMHINFPYLYCTTSIFCP